ncbi:hypothetical protein K440DRAFT_506635, partial [Wilcoxina mikolae CBS 423.85]
IQKNMSTTFNLQTNVLVEKVNQIREWFLWIFAAANKHRWDHLLILVEFSYNSHMFRTYGMSSF